MITSGWYSTLAEPFSNSDRYQGAAGSPGDWGHEGGRGRADDRNATREGVDTGMDSIPRDNEAPSCV